MGERGVIQLKSKDIGSVCFYTHWRGYKMRELAKEVIAARMRWDDHTYFASIMFRHLTGDYQGAPDIWCREERRGLEPISLSFGIWAGKPDKIGDQNYPTVVIDLDKKTIKQARFDHTGPLSMTFDQVARGAIG